MRITVVGKKRLKNGLVLEYSHNRLPLYRHCRNNDIKCHGLDYNCIGLILKLHRFILATAFMVFCCFGTTCFFSWLNWFRANF